MKIENYNGYDIKDRLELERKKLEQLEQEIIDLGDLEEDELEDSLDKQYALKHRSKDTLYKTKNRSHLRDIKSLRERVDRGSVLDPSERDLLKDYNTPEAKDILRINERNLEPRGFTLSPLKLLIRSL